MGSHSPKPSAAIRAPNGRGGALLDRRLHRDFPGSGVPSSVREPELIGDPIHFVGF
jgi:hypothetical protein